MRVLIVSILLAGGTLALGGCATTTTPEVMTVAERAEQCLGSTELRPTGRTTGNPRHDYRCVGPHDTRASRESRPQGAASAANGAVDRSLRRGY